MALPPNYGLINQGMKQMTPTEQLSRGCVGVKGGGTLLSPKSIWSLGGFLLKGCTITGTCTFRVHTKHDQTLLWLSLLSCKPSLFPFAVATNWLDRLRFANREQFQKHMSATHPHGALQLKSNIKHIHSIPVHPSLNLVAGCHIMYNTSATVGSTDYTETDRGEKSALEPRFPFH